MSTVPDFRTNVWRQACRSIQIEESFAHITEILAHYIPFQQAILFAIDQKKSVMEALAYGFPAPPGARESHIHLSDTQLLALLGGPAPTSLFHTGGNDPRSELIAQLFPHYHKQDCIAGLLNYQERYRGLVLFIANPSTRFSPSHRTQIADLLEPLSVALGNDHILRELNVLREAAERDKEALLHRLGRTELGDTIIGSTTTLRAVMERVDLVARSDLPILILGETGTGKELIAREIHRRSLRASGPIMRVNCGAIPPQLIDSQLFGHQRGAFTGATDTHKGWFERADGGTLFLDEIGELSLSVQVRLLRILQDGWLERVGSSKPIKVDVRVIAATHRDLATMVKQGEFREDLWYRIAVFPLQLPPLRERLEDIPQLVKYFAERSAVRFNLPFQLPHQEDYALLASYNWPGNIRELASVIDRAALLGNGKTLELHKALGTVQPASAPPPTRQPSPSAEKETPILPLDEVMRQHIIKTLQQTGGRIEGPTGAAKLLDINPHTLRARMRKLGVHWNQFRKKAQSDPTETDYII